METARLAIELTALLPICSLGPGLLLVSRLRWSPAEKLCAASAASFICIYLASFGLFNRAAGAWAYWLILACFALMGLARWRTAAILARRGASRRILLGFLLVLIWDYLHLGLVRNFGAGNWYGDWIEHFLRTKAFLGEFPRNYPIMQAYSLAARPPMMNAIAAFFCRLTETNFQSYSAVFLFLNAWAYVPCALLTQMFRPRMRRGAYVLAVLFMLNPSIMENAAYP